MRVITIVSTRGGRIEKFELEDGLTWGTLREEIRTRLPEIEELVAVESVNKTTLSSVESVVPDGDIRIFLRPGNTKAGIDFSEMSFAEMRAFISEDAHNKAELNAMASKELGKNWTTLSKEEMAKFLDIIFNGEGEEEEEEEEYFQDDLSASDEKGTENFKVDFREIAKALEKSSGSIIKEEDINYIELISMYCHDLITEYYKEIDSINEDLKKLGFTDHGC